MTRYCSEAQAGFIAERLAEIAAARDGYVLSEMREFGEEPKTDEHGERIPNESDYRKDAYRLVNGMTSFLELPLATLSEVIQEAAQMEVEC